ncbi:CreA protein [Enhydrobacter aerosaccus]|uniref:CreA protein n=2 Tax=Enhydrobacter aerosaccus TaxID=225324 RepID=A0A1T4S895_9HYPH|nr:CreA family protein [Enhydrobacter aerosaccus]SKA24377.1 CreA protein [Enhydrobacter aerosaccus]
MRRLLFGLLLSTLAVPALADEIGSVGYRFKWIGPNDKIVVEAFDDPDVPGVTCYFSHARTGGLKGAIGVAEDPGEASIACRQVGAVDESALGKLKSPHEVFSERASLIFKSTQVVRFWDAKRRALVYLTYTDRIFEGSPRNSISVVPLGVK